MIEHMVFFKVKEENKNVEKIAAALIALQEKVPNIREISAGRNFSDRSQGFNLGLRVLLNSDVDLDAYRQHPAHVHVLETLIKPAVEAIVVMDYHR